MKGNRNAGAALVRGAATSASLSNPYDVAVDAAGNRYIADTRNYRIRKVTPAGVISTIAGTGTRGFGGDGGAASAAQFASIWHLAVDASGNVFLADYENHRIRKISAAGIISTVAGTGAGGFGGDGGAATSASFNLPMGIAVDGSGNLFINDSGNHRIRKVSTAGTVTTVAGDGVAGFSGDGGPAASAQISYPTGLAVGAGSLHIADWGNNRIRRIGLFENCAAEGFSGSKLNLCRQVCEIDQTPSRLASLIKLYVTAYGSEPPCAR